ncbi:Pectate lyase superfamily protein [uncultured Caudovirales phage]|uniref:Pectate lyase superfamily protein n=1 Tax=uncultured Caudovirales phage TaxID=2100421 RepID=A0A6J5PR69_9CAUD|nr:Pectate lyase superfamily protein [uncultured Caudovirales phage]CAB4150037.1 Pectate lyase superfamily protein [uncultured Caudovirales phage]CAB4170034.1 Pectate lyase superfamily protein [uncultured Caudovirales phage]CAB4182500.1 Pectate lyase superfamily protein [uncultured Caudovirales phage]CAB4198259.1 Pectate lyase superfamily protein [uncultured Caudovirales phage]
MSESKTFTSGTLINSGWLNAVDATTYEALGDGSLNPPTTRTQVTTNIQSLATGTGAVARSVQSKLNDFVSVKDFGATGNGTTNDTVAIQAAMLSTSTAGKRLFFPAGIYLVTDSLIMCQYTNIYGEYNYQGWNDSTNNRSTIIQFTPTSAKSLFVASTSNGTSDGFVSDISISDMCLFGDNTANSQSAIYASQVIYSAFKNLKIWNFQTGVRCAQTINNRFENLNIGYCTTACVTYNESTPTTDVWEQCTFNKSPIGVDTSDNVAIGIRFNNCLFEDLTTYGVNLSKGCSSWAFTNCYSENVPSSNLAYGSMFHIGFDGTAVGVVSSLDIIGGVYQGSSVYASTAGTWLNVDESYSVKVVAPHILNIGTIVRTTANTVANAITFLGNSIQGTGAFYSGPTGKLTGIYSQYELNNGEGNIVILRGRDVVVDQAYFTNATYNAVTVAALPVVSSVGAGAAAFVNNASLNTFGSVAVTSSTALASVVITGTAGQFSCTAATLQIGMQLNISGTFGGTGSITGYTNPKSYYVIATNGTTTFTLSATAGGAAITTTVGTPTGLTYLIGYMVPVYSDGMSWRIG